jgi:hypothetical protein
MKKTDIKTRRNKSDEEWNYKVRELIRGFAGSVA